MPNSSHHISSAVVMTHPDDVEALQARLAALAGVEVRGSCQGKIVVVIEGDQLAMRFTPKCGCSGKSRPEGRMTSIHGAPARLRA